MPGGGDSGCIVALSTRNALTVRTPVAQPYPPPVLQGCTFEREVHLALDDADDDAHGDAPQSTQTAGPATCPPLPLQ